MMCSGAVDTIYILKALIDGADGVLVGGCHPGDCHYQTGNYKARRRVAILKEILNQVGFSDDRIWLRWISASEGKLFADTVTQMVDELKKMGPNPMKQLWLA
jgi:F420-non-reducing hydrogenase iron-sulfur subunit